jgi:hypothetical protein
MRGFSIRKDTLTPMLKAEGGRTTSQAIDAVYRGMVDTAQQVESEAVENVYAQGAVDMSTLANSSVIEENPLKSVRVVFRASHARVVEYGRRPGKKQPPLAPIKRWCKRHLGDAGAAYMVARHIGRDGIPARPYFGPAWLRAEDNLRENIRRRFAEVK